MFSLQPKQRGKHYEKLSHQLRFCIPQIETTLPLLKKSKLRLTGQKSMNLLGL